MQLIDIGANLTHESFDADRDAVLARAQAAGVARIVVTGSTAEDSVKALALARAHPSLLMATAGVHPHHAGNYDDNCDAQLRALLREDEVVAVGECGLDYFRDFSPRPTQQRAFERQLQIAADMAANGVGKPLFLHQREAHADLMAMLRGFDGRLGRVVVHCFTGDRRALFESLDSDCYIGITGWLCDERRGAHLRELVRHIPADRLLVETDAPYLLPRTLRPRPADRRNEPMHLVHVVEKLAQDRGETVEACAAATSANARKFFGLDERPAR